MLIVYLSSFELLTLLLPFSLATPALVHLSTTRSLCSLFPLLLPSISYLTFPPGLRIVWYEQPATAATV
jgi:hypothetical protein